MAAPESDADFVYLDNSATTIMPPAVIDTVIQWMNRGDPSAEYAAAREARKMMQRFRKLIAADGGFELEGPRGFSIIFTSGGSESNAHVVTSATRAYATRTGKLPHVIVSAVEHKSLLVCCLQLARDRIIQLTVLPVRTCSAGAQRTGDTGTVDPNELWKAIRPNTCLISIIAANGDTGAINDLRALGGIAHESQIPFHTDAVQLFGKSIIYPEELNIDSFSGSFHKLHGPPGVGFLAVRNDFVEGYGLGALICGFQNEGLRGGTENLPGIAGALTAYKRMATGRGEKNRQVRHLRDGIQTALARRFPAVNIDDYCKARPRVPDGNPATPNSARVLAAPKTKNGVALARRLDDAAEKDKPVLVWIGPKDRTKILPNVLFFAVLRMELGGLCNKKARAALERDKVIVSIGSACNKEPSHVVEALDVPPELCQSVLRVSLSDDTTAEDAAAFIDSFTKVVTSSKVLLD